MSGKVIVVTLNYNQNQYTLYCINSLLKSDYNNFQILLIDNGSTEKNYADLEHKLPNDTRLVLRRITLGCYGIWITYSYLKSKVWRKKDA